MKKRNKILIILLMSFVFTNAQDLILDRHGVLYKDKNLVGYYFLKHEAKSKKETEHSIEVYDLNLALTSKVTFTSIPQYTVGEVRFEEEFLLVKEVRQIRAEKFIGRILLLNIQTGNNIAQFELPAEDVGCTYFLLPGNIIIRNRNVAGSWSGVQGSLECINNDNSIKWKVDYKDESVKYSFVQEVSKFGINSVMVVVGKRGGMFGAGIVEHHILDLSTGAEEAKILQPNDEKFRSTFCYLINLNNGKYLLYGNYYLKDEDPVKLKANCENQGLYFNIYDQEGKLLKSKKYTYEEYFKRTICLDRKPDTRHINNVIVRQSYVEDNKISFIFHTDEFPIPKEPNNNLKKTIAGNVYLFEMDQDLNVLTWNNLEGSISEKQELLPNQKYLKVRQPDVIYYKDKKLINVIAMVKKNKNIGLEQNKFISLLYKAGEPLKIDEVDINGEADITEFWEAKPGYLMVFEYFEKEKKMDKRLIKLSY